MGLFSALEERMCEREKKLTNLDRELRESGVRETETKAALEGKLFSAAA